MAYYSYQTHINTTKVKGSRKKKKAWSGVSVFQYDTFQAAVTGYELLTGKVFLPKNKLDMEVAETFMADFKAD